MCKGAREGGGARAHRTELQCKEKRCTRALELSSGHSKYSQHAMYEAERNNSRSQGRTEIKSCRGSASPKKTHKKCGGCPSASGGTTRVRVRIWRTGDVAGDPVYDLIGNRSEPISMRPMPRYRSYLLMFTICTESNPLRSKGTTGTTAYDHRWILFGSDYCSVQYKTAPIGCYRA